MYTSTMIMIRTQVYIPQPLHHQLISLAKKRGESMARIVRNFLEKGLHECVSKDLSGKETIEKILSMKVTGGPKDLSQKLDHYLYDIPETRE